MTDDLQFCGGFKCEYIITTAVTQVLYHDQQFITFEGYNCKSYIELPGRHARRCGNAMVSKSRTAKVCRQVYIVKEMVSKIVHEL